MVTARCQPRGARPSNRVVTSRMPAFTHSSADAARKPAERGNRHAAKTEARRRAERDAIRAAEATK